MGQYNLINVSYLCFNLLIKITIIIKVPVVESAVMFNFSIVSDNWDWFNSGVSNSYESEQSDSYLHGCIDFKLISWIWELCLNVPAIGLYIQNTPIFCWSSLDQMSKTGLVTLEKIFIWDIGIWFNETCWY